MHKEYAVEPSAIGQSWEIFRYLIEKFDFPFLKTNLVTLNESRITDISAWPDLIPENGPVTVEMVWDTLRQSSYSAKWFASPGNRADASNSASWVLNVSPT